MKKLDLKVSDFETIEGFDLYDKSDFNLYQNGDNLEIWINKDFVCKVDEIVDFEEFLFENSDDFSWVDVYGSNEKMVVPHDEIFPHTFTDYDYDCEETYLYTFELDTDCFLVFDEAVNSWVIKKKGV